MLFYLIIHYFSGSFLFLSLHLLFREKRKIAFFSLQLHSRWQTAHLESTLDTRVRMHLRRHLLNYKLLTYNFETKQTGCGETEAKFSGETKATNANWRGNWSGVEVMGKPSLEVEMESGENSVSELVSSDSAAAG